MKVRTWRAFALTASMAVVVLLLTQRAAGQPSNAGEENTRLGGASVSLPIDLANSPAIPESGGLLLLGSAFVIVAQQLRRMA